MQFPSFWSSRDLANVPASQQHAAFHLAELFSSIDGIGHPTNRSATSTSRTQTDGTDATPYNRLAWSTEEAWLRVWFAAQMLRRGFNVSTDDFGNQWAWIGGHPSPETPGISIGSHLDSVPNGGAFDGPLGVLSAIAAYDQLHESGWTPSCPLGIVNFHDEEGGRFAIACFGSRMSTGLLSWEQALSMKDKQGITYAEALAAFPDFLREVRRQAPSSQALGVYDSATIDKAIRASAAPTVFTGTVTEETLRLSRQSIAAHVELHIEQGCAQRDLAAPIAVADMIWPHGRWRVDLRGVANHAGTTPMKERHNPMIAFAKLVLETQQAALKYQARATVGKAIIQPNGVNVIPSHIIAWLDCRAQRVQNVNAVVGDLQQAAAKGMFNAYPKPVHSRTANGNVVPDCLISQESWTEKTLFSPQLRGELVRSVEQTLGSKPPVIGTAAGHDAGILAETSVAAGMIFVRNMTGASHTPDEYATPYDCALGVEAYAGIVQDVAQQVAEGWRPQA